MTESTSARSFDIETILANRWSPRAYSSTEVLTSDRLGPAFEAARWSPSSGNSQPWSFVVGFRGDVVFTQIVETMASGNAVWAEKASAVVANIAELVSEEGKERSHAIYDLGQAVAHFSAQATANGLMVHQMAGFDADALGEVLGLGERHRVISLMTVGVLGDPRDLPEKLQEREGAPRVRKPLHVVATGSVNYL
jgi:nitroreductase